MFKRNNLPRWISLLAALWLLGQLAAAFHLDHAEPEGFASGEHSCLLCKVAAADDVIVPSALLLALSVCFFIPSYVVVVLARRKAEWRFQARAPPPI